MLLCVEHHFFIQGQVVKESSRLLENRLGDLGCNAMVPNVEKPGAYSCVPDGLRNGFATLEVGVCDVTDINDR